MAVSSAGGANGAGNAVETGLQRSRAQEGLSGAASAGGWWRLRGQLQLPGHHLQDPGLCPGLDYPQNQQGGSEQGGSCQLF